MRVTSCILSFFKKIFILLDEEVSKRNSHNLLGLVWSLSLRSLPLEVRVIPKAKKRRFEWAKGVHVNVVYVEQSLHYESTPGEAHFLLGICHTQSSLQLKGRYMLF